MNRSRQYTKVTLPLPTGPLTLIILSQDVLWIKNQVEKVAVSLKVARTAVITVGQNSIILERETCKDLRFFTYCERSTGQNCGHRKRNRIDPV